MNPVFSNSPWYAPQQASFQPFPAPPAQFPYSDQSPVPFSRSPIQYYAQTQTSGSLGIVKTPAGDIELLTEQHDFILPTADLEEGDRKYCRCLEEVEAKGGAYSPYGVCRSHVAGYVHSCSKYYNWSVMSLDMLVAYADLHKIDSSQMTTRENAIQQIGQWKASRKEKFGE